MDKLLKKESKNNDVKRVQEWLNLARYVRVDWNYHVTIDGDYGGQTEAIVKRFQSMIGLKDDGVVGSKTWGMLRSPIERAFAKDELVINQTVRGRILLVATQHLQNIPRELKQNTGPWVRCYMDGNEGMQWAWCMGYAQAVIDQALSQVGKKFTDIMPHTYSCDIVGKYGINEECLIRNKELKASDIEPGDLFLKVKSKYDWVHTGIVSDVDGDWIRTYEGNTNDEGDREGYEVCKRMRNYKKSNIDIFKLKI